MKNYALLICLLFLVSFAQLVYAQNETANETNIGINETNIQDEGNFSDTESPIITIKSPKEKVETLTPLIKISVEEENLDSCWYNITRSVSGVVEIPMTEIENCEEEEIPEGVLTYSLKFNLNIFVNDTFGNSAMEFIEFTTPEPTKQEITEINNVNNNNNNINNSVNIDNENTNNFDLGEWIGGIFKSIGDFFKNLFG